MAKKPANNPSKGNTMPANAQEKAAESGTATATATAEAPKPEKAPVDREALQVSLKDSQAKLQHRFKDAADKHCKGDLFAAMNHPDCKPIYIELAAVTTKLEKAIHSPSRRKKVRVLAEEFAKEINAGLESMPFVVNGVTYPSVLAWTESVRDNRYGALKDANTKGELAFRVSGLRKAAGSGEGSCRLVHRDKEGNKIDKNHADKKLILSNQATPALSKLTEKYPKVAAELNAKFGSDENMSAIDKRRKLFEDNKRDQKAVVFTLPDGTTLTQQR